MKRILYIIIILAFCTSSAIAQETYLNAIMVNQFTAKKEGNNAVINFNINLDSLNIKSQEMITLTPVVKNSDSTLSHKFSPIVITGKKRNTALNRSIGLNNFEFEETPSMIVRNQKNTEQNLPVRLEMPYADWLHQAQLVLYEDITGCACADKGNNNLMVMNPVFPPIYNPSYGVGYITPPAEEVKQRSETYAAHLNFKVAKYDLLPEFDNNAEVLAEVDAIVNEIRSDTNLIVTDFHIVGYASPEGNYNSNMKLSENRAEVFVNYLRNRYGISESAVKTDWRGEDWDGLRKEVEMLDFDDKQAVLDIIDNETDINTRKQKLHQLSGGKTYRWLLSEYYPPLRRNEYTISYVARPFNVSEARELIKSKPHHLSQNEMFLVANTYPKDSDEFKEIFDIVVQHYPDNSIAQANLAAYEIENGLHQNAISRLEAIDTPEAWNNLGCAHAKMGNHEKAAEYFKRAADMNYEVAQTNLNEYNTWVASLP